MKKLFLDVETGGVDPGKHAVLQIAAIFEVNDREKWRFSTKVRPWSEDIVEDEALAVTGIQREEIESFPAPLAVLREFVGMLDDSIDRFNKQDKAFFIAYNSPFDNQFMRNFFLKGGEKWFGSYFWTPDICVMRMAHFALMGSRKQFQNFQLSTVARHYGIDTEGAHDAMKDVEMARSIWKKITEKPGQQISLW